MDKKTYVLKALELLKDTWDLARAWIIIINQMEVDEAILDIIIKTIDTSLEQAKESEEKKKLTGLKEYLEKVKSAETVSQEQDKISLADLDKLLETM
ncbi:hypothetical protein P148_SR1C00001G0002 [candidate division SR1 bacterium RAAC1_SR1_1]|nr:hypothetical protein P148_SR1C00001G0002 [candidate division SR1 bacterium RAAC1_SR1_1]